MHFRNFLGLSAVLSLGSGAVAYPNPHEQDWQHYAQQRQHLQFRRQEHLSNGTIASSTQHSTTASSTQPPITPAPEPTLSTGTPSTRPGTTAVTSAAAAATTISDGEIVIGVIGATYVVGAGGAILSVAGVPHALGAGTTVAVTAGGPNGDIPEIEEISNDNPEDPQTSESPEDSQTSEPPEVTQTSTALSTETEWSTSTSSYQSTSSAPTSTPTPYVVLFSPNATDDEILAVDEALYRLAAPDSLMQVTSDRTGLVVFSKANITSTLAGIIREEPGVSLYWRTHQHQTIVLI